jgi:hypothetical protein
MKSHFSGSKLHFVDQALLLFQERLDKDVNTLLSSHFALFSKTLEKFANHLRGRPLLDYQISEEGYAIRAQLKDMLPQLEDKVH